MDRGACWATVHGVTKRWTRETDQAHTKQIWVFLMLLLLLRRFHRVLFCATSQTAAHQAPPVPGILKARTLAYIYIYIYIYASLFGGSQFCFIGLYVCPIPVPYCFTLLKLCCKSGKQEVQYLHLCSFPKLLWLFWDFHVSP